MKIPDEIAQQLKFQYEGQQVSSCRLSQETVCEDCGKTVENRSIKYSKLKNPWPHWQTQCQNCKLCKNEYTGEWQTNTELRRFLRSKKQE